MGNCQKFGTATDGTPTATESNTVPELPVSSSPKASQVERGRGYSYSANSIYEYASGQANHQQHTQEALEKTRNNQQPPLDVNCVMSSPSTSRAVSFEEPREDYCYAQGLPVSAEDYSTSKNEDVEPMDTDMVEESESSLLHRTEDSQRKELSITVTPTPPQRQKSVKFMDVDEQQKVQSKIEAEVDVKRQLDRLNIRLSLSSINMNAQPLKPSWRQVGLATPPPVLIPIASPKTRAEMHLAKQLRGLNIRRTESNPGSPSGDEFEDDQFALNVEPSPARPRLPSAALRPNRSEVHPTAMLAGQIEHGSSPSPSTGPAQSPQDSSSQRGPGGRSPQSSESPVALPGPGSLPNEDTEADDMTPNYPSLPNESPSQAPMIAISPSQESPNSLNSKRSYMSYTSTEAKATVSTVMDMTRPSFTQQSSLRDLLQRISSVAGDDDFRLGIIEGEVEASAELFCLAKSAREELRSVSAIKEKIHQLERVIKILNGVLPKVTEMLNTRPKAKMDPRLIQQIFRNMNISRTGFVSYSEFKHCMVNLNVTDEDRMIEAFHSIDQNQDNLLDIQEFQANIQEIVDLQHRQVCMTHVIQDLLRRVQEQNLSASLRTDFSQRTPIRLERVLDHNEIVFLVQQTAWIRNHVLVAGMTDEADAKMVTLGAKDIQRSLHHILKRLEETKNTTSPEQRELT